MPIYNYNNIIVSVVFILYFICIAFIKWKSSRIVIMHNTIFSVSKKFLFDQTARATTILCYYNVSNLYNPKTCVMSRKYFRSEQLPRIGIRSYLQRCDKLNFEMFTTNSDVRTQFTILNHIINKNIKRNIITILYCIVGYAVLG